MYAPDDKSNAAVRRRSQSAAPKLPRYVRFVDSFDAIGMTAGSEIQRNKLREYALSDLGLTHPKRAPRASAAAKMG
jgi:hypothetical protein